MNMITRYTQKLARFGKESVGKGHEMKNEQSAA